MVCDGTLSGRDAERVEQALAGNRELARRYELVRRSPSGAVAICVGIACDAISGISESNESGG